jgi:hypothetical protein
MTTTTTTTQRQPQRQRQRHNDNDNDNGNGNGNGNDNGNDKGQDKINPMPSEHCRPRRTSWKMLGMFFHGSKWAMGNGQWVG